MASSALMTTLERAISAYSTTLEKIIQCPSKFSPSDSIPYPDLSENYIGSFIFLSYIAAALFLTFSILSSLYTNYTRLPDSARSKLWTSRANQARVILAMASFLNLSYDMSMFLVTSFVDYRENLLRHERATTFFALASELGDWMLHTALFTDFARNLLGSMQGWILSMGALSGTLGSHMFMNSMGYEQQIPHLWMYITLGQILPISFSTALFILALNIHSSSTQPTTKPFILPPSSAGYFNIYAFTPSIFLFSSAAFLSTLPCVDRSSSPHLLGGVAIARLYLVFPFLASSAPSMRVESRQFKQIVLVSVVLCSAYEFPGNFVWLWDTAGLDNGYAVKALARDFMFLVPISFLSSVEEG